MDVVDEVDEEDGDEDAADRGEPSTHQGRRASKQVSRLQYYAYYLHTRETVSSPPSAVPVGSSKNGWPMPSLR